MIHKQGKIFVSINLFDIFHGEICVSDDGKLYGFKKGEIVKLIMGVWNEKSYKEILTNNEELKLNLMKK